MKITKERLEQIIQEEISQVYADSASDSPNADVPAISDEVRAEELLNQFKSMLKPEEQQVEGSCGTFLRQLAALADRIEKGSTAGTNIN